MPQAATYTPATDKQISFLRTLAKDRQVNADESEVLSAILTDGVATLSKITASAWISTLVKRDKVTGITANGATPQQSVAPGYYVKDESYFEVVLSKAGRAYAKQLNQRPSGSWGWDYAKGAVASLTESDRLTAEQAAEFGWMHGTCLRCCADLTVPESVSRGYGPVCAKKMGF